MLGSDARDGYASMAPWPLSPLPDDCIHVVIEIPRGSRNKYEIDHDTGRVFLDRRLFTATTYPADYGYIPEHAGRRRRRSRCARAAGGRGISRRVGRCAARRSAVHARRGRRGRQDPVRPAEGTALERRARSHRSHAATGQRDPALLRGLQGARARQGVVDRPGSLGETRHGTRSAAPRQLRPPFVTLRRSCRVTLRAVSPFGHRWLGRGGGNRGAGRGMSCRLTAVSLVGRHRGSAQRTESHLPGRRRPADPDGRRPARLDRPPRRNGRTAGRAHPAECGDAHRAGILVNTATPVANDPSPPRVPRRPGTEPAATGEAGRPTVRCSPRSG